MAKGPKTLNPADRARREARKKELKKNKKQRQQVRSAAIESRDPEQILADLESLDKTEFDVNNIGNPDRQPGGTNDLMFKEKRKRLKELWARVISYYQKEDPDKYSSLKKLEAQYEANHRKIERDYEAIRAAREVTIEDIFLPPEPDQLADLDDEIPDDDPLMSDSVYITPLSEGTLKAPGCPPGPPPDLKQLVASLKSSLNAPPIFIAQTVPQNLLNLGTSSKPHGSRKFDRKNGAGGKQRNGGRDTSQTKSRSGGKPQLLDSDNKKPFKTVEMVKDAAKSAVIESKPVLFLQKATKFVPASVRSKVHKPAGESK